jgi:acetyl-CoA synthetase
VQHSTGGYLLHAIVTMKWTFDLKPDDLFWCTADIGWVTGHTYITYGPLACGATEVVFEGIPTYPDAGRFWKMIQDHKVSIFYTAPTAIRSLVKAADTNPAVAPTQYDLSSLRLLGTVGEPINPAAWQWYYDSVGGGRCPIVDTFWQTETGGHMITPLPGVTPMVPGSCTLPFPGIQAAVVDETGTELDWGKGGLLVVKKPWPAMIRNIWGDPERFKKSYYPDDFAGKLYLAGDGSIRDVNTGYFTITGRIDDVLNVSGHRMGTMEIESALVSHPMVAEAAVVGRPDDLTGEAICAFVVLKGPRPTGEAAKKMIKELQDHVGREIGPIAKPKDLRFGENLPKTRSGKIMRRLLRSLARAKPSPRMSRRSRTRPFSSSCGADAPGSGKVGRSAPEALAFLADARWQGQTRGVSSNRLQAGAACRPVHLRRSRSSHEQQCDRDAGLGVHPASCRSTRPSIGWKRQRCVFSPSGSAGTLSEAARRFCRVRWALRGRFTSCSGAGAGAHKRGD